jgi:hypothetical protein
MASGRKKGALMPTDSEQAEAVALAHQMGYADTNTAARAKLEGDAAYYKSGFETVLEAAEVAKKRYEARVRELEAALVEAESALDRCNDFPCSFCKSADYGAQVGIEHRGGCLIVRLRAALKGGDADDAG